MNLMALRTQVRHAAFQSANTDPTFLWWSKNCSASNTQSIFTLAVSARLAAQESCSAVASQFSGICVLRFFSLLPDRAVSFFFVTVVVVGCLRACADAIPAVLADAIRSLDLSVSFISLLCVHSPSKMSKNSEIFGRTIFHLLVVILVTLASHLSSSGSGFARRQ